ncbi:hypothetical protein B296_00034332 [Ensete ventricosum]|uniref:Yippee domain-containing protein n=1 Tax=Ensete ventricosum TaxID=4639 RepID=A0A426Z9G4_ENSVE|nr:hypothetical protein B296_00034332 [Ensete ventricosum]
MGRIFTVELDGRVYRCRFCRTQLALAEDLISKLTCVDREVGSSGDVDEVRSGVQLGSAEDSYTKASLGSVGSPFSSPSSSSPSIDTARNQPATVEINCYRSTTTDDGRNQLLPPDNGRRWSALISRWTGTNHPYWVVRFVNADLDFHVVSATNSSRYKSLHFMEMLLCPVSR